MGLSFYCHFSLALMLVALFLSTHYLIVNVYFLANGCVIKRKLNNAGSDHAKRQKCVISLSTQIYIQGDPKLMHPPGSHNWDSKFYMDYCRL